MKSLLEGIAEPRDIQHFSFEELRQLAEECRQRIIDVTSKQGGHLASSLGTVDLIVALYHIFDFSKDRIVWDVGHQTYAHKLLSGRNANFDSLGLWGGVRKFLSPEESSYDHFAAGHASTSISAALGMAIGRDLTGGKEHVISVIGDGGLTGGLAFEALNHNGHAEKKVLLIVNDNGHSIDSNVGAVSKLFTRFLATPLYNRVRDETLDLADRVPFSGHIRTSMHRLNASIKTFLTPGMLFEQLGWRYFGPVDGHKIEELLEILDQVKDLDGPVVLHVLTQKGKGYSFAEENAFRYHGVTPFSMENGKFHKEDAAPSKKQSYSSIFAEKLGELMKKDPKIVAISAAMMSGTGIMDLHKQYPDRVLDVGIAEGHAVTCAAGMATEGVKPFVAIYSTFLQRSIDHIIHDVALQNLPVRFMLDRSGFVGADGPTHHGIYDLSYLRMIPNMTLLAPRNGTELSQMVEFAYTHETGPCAVRYPRGESVVEKDSDSPEIILGKAHVLQDGKDIALFAVGSMVDRAVEVAKQLETQGHSVAVINARFIKPLDNETLLRYASSASLIVTLEENTICGGFGGAVLEELSQNNLNPSTLQLGVPDRVIPHGTPEQQCVESQLSVPQIIARILERV